MIRTRVLGDGGALPEGLEKQRAVEAMFDRVAPDYDRLNRIISLGRDRAWRTRTVTSLRLRPGARVLDVACGTGDLMRDARDAGYVPVGVDLSAGMLDVANTQGAFVRGDAARLPFASDSFDGAVCGFALRNFVAISAVFGEVGRLLRSGGRFAALDAAVPENALMRAGSSVWFRGAVPLLGRLLTHEADAYRYLPRSTAYLPAPDELLKMLTEAGFVQVERRTMMGGSVQLLTGTRS